MRVLLANKFFYLKGGAERAFFDFDAALGRRGHETVHFAMAHPENRPSPWSSYFASQVSYERGGLDRGTLRSLSRMFWSREVRDKVARLVRDARPDVAVLHNTYHQLGPTLPRELAARGVPTLMVLHDYKVSCPSYQRLRGGEECSLCAGGRFARAVVHGCGGSRARGAVLAAESYWQWDVLRTYSRIDGFVAPSRYLIEVVRAMGFPFPIELLRNAVEVPASPVDPAAGDALGYAGRLSAEKGLDTLLDAAARAPQIPVRIAGDGPLAGHLARRVAREGLDGVRLLGNLPHDDLLQEVAGWRGAVVPSLWPENCPYSVLEPFSLGVPVIGTALGGLPELLEGRGLLVPPGDPAALSEAMTALFEDRTRCRELGARGRELALEECDPDAFGARLEALLGALVDGVAGPARRRAAATGRARSGEVR